MTTTATGSRGDQARASEASGSGTRVTVTHRGWSKLRADHPARHGLGIEAFVRMMGMWWGGLLTARREHVGLPRARRGC